MTKFTKAPLFAEVHNVPDDYHFTTEELDRIITGDMFTPRQGAIMARELKQYRAAMLNSEPVSNRDELADEVTDGMQQAKATMLQWLQEGKQIFDPAYLEEGNYPVIPDFWTSVDEKLPEEFGRYWCYVEEINSLGKSHYQWNCSWNGDDWGGEGFIGRVTHWMPLPARPRNVPEMSKSEKFDIALSRAMENNKDTLSALAKK